MHSIIFVFRKIIELEEELKIVTNNMKSLEIAEQEVYRVTCMSLSSTVQFYKTQSRLIAQQCTNGWRLLAK